MTKYEMIANDLADRINNNEFKELFEYFKKYAKNWFVVMII